MARGEEEEEQEHGQNQAVRDGQGYSESGLRALRERWDYRVGSDRVRVTYINGAVGSRRTLKQ